MSTTQSTAGPPGLAVPTDGGQRRIGRALIVIAAAQLMVVLDATIVNAALPHMQKALGFPAPGRNG